MELLVIILHMSLKVALLSYHIVAKNTVILASFMYRFGMLTKVVI